MSLFVVYVPTRETELELRKKELELQNAKYVSPGASPRASLLSNESANERGSLRYMATTGGRSMEIIVSDDFMEVKEATPSSQKLQILSPKMLDDERIQAEIEKYFLEKHLEDTLDIFNITNATWASVGKTMNQVEFIVSANVSDTIIRRFQSVGIGTKFDSSISVFTATIYSGPTKVLDSKQKDGQEEEKEEPENKSGWSDFVQSIKARLTVAQVVSQIQAVTTITFDYLMFVSLAAVIASLGLLENNSVILVASMLISPLMGPIMAITFGSVIRDWKLIRTGAKSEVIGLTICLVIGFAIGAGLATDAFEGPWANSEAWPTNEMVARGQLRSLIVGVLMAIPSGAGVALSVLAGNAGSLVGVAISASLLPPATNCGIFWGLAFVIYIRHGKASGNWDAGCHTKMPYDKYVNGYKIQWCSHIAHEFTYLGIFSFLLTIVNIVVIYVVAIIILKIKEVAPYATRKSLRRFWQEDLALARKYNEDHHGEDMNTGIINDINATGDVTAVKDKLDEDNVLRQINRRVGGGGQAGGNILQDLKTGLSVGSDIELPRNRKYVEQREPSQHSQHQKQGGWLSGWFGGSKRAADLPAS